MAGLSAPFPAVQSVRPGPLLGCNPSTSKSSSSISSRLDRIVSSTSRLACSIRVPGGLRRAHDPALLLVAAEAARSFVEALGECRGRIRILTPNALMSPGVAAALAVFSLYQGPGLGVL